MPDLFLKCYPGSFECRILTYSTDLKWVVTFSHTLFLVAFEFTFVLLRPCHHSPFPNLWYSEERGQWYGENSKSMCHFPFTILKPNLVEKLLTSVCVGRVRTWQLSIPCLHPLWNPEKAITDNIRGTASRGNIEVLAFTLKSSTHLGTRLPVFLGRVFWLKITRQ